MVAASLFILYQANLSPAYRSPFDSRLLSPIHALFIIIVFGLCGRAWRDIGLIVRSGLILLFFWGLFLYLPRSVNLVSSFREDGIGFASSYWRDLEAGNFLLNHQGKEVFTTAPIGVYFSLNLDTKRIEMPPDQLRSHLRETNGYLVVFNSMPLELYGYSSEEFLEGMTRVAEFNDCAVYQVSP